MKPVFVQTENYKRFLAGIHALKNRGAAEACLLVVDGDPGLGKTTITNRWAVQTGSIYLRAKEKWTPSWMLRELLAELNEQPEHRFEQMYRQSLRLLKARDVSAMREDTTFAVVIDEADHISNRKEILETLRDLSDMLELPFILVGMGRIRQNLARFRQISSRIGQPIDFRPCELSDVSGLVSGLCEVPVGPDMIAFLHRESKGYSREIKEGIAAIERFGRRYAGQSITCELMDGQVLLVDRATGREIRVRRAA